MSPSISREVLDERLDLRVGLDRDEAVLDLARRALVGQPALEARGAVRVLLRQLADLAVERGREEHRLAVARQPAHDLVDLRQEAHVEHPIGLVEDEDADLR